MILATLTITVILILIGKIRVSIKQNKTGKVKGNNIKINQTIDNEKS